MEKSVWETVLLNWASSYYTEVFWLFCTIVAFATGIKNYRKERTNQLLLFYLFSSFLLIDPLFSITTHLFDMDKSARNIYIEEINILFAFIEISTFFYLFNKIFSRKVVTHLLLIFWTIALCAFVFFYWSLTVNKITIIRIRENSTLAICLEFILLLLFCLLFLYQLLTKEKSTLVPLIQSPSFWIICGLFFYCIVSIPYLVIGSAFVLSNINFYTLMGSVHYISIGILFICIAKAFSCKATLTT